MSAKTAAALHVVEENVRKSICTRIAGICSDKYVFLNSLFRLVQCCCSQKNQIIVLFLLGPAVHHIKDHQSLRSYREVQGILQQSASFYALLAIPLLHALCMPQSVQMVAPHRHPRGPYDIIFKYTW